MTARPPYWGGHRPWLSLPRQQLAAGKVTYIENGGPEMPIVIQDKIFVDNKTIALLDPTWQGPRATGSLWYAHVYERARWQAANRQYHPQPFRRRGVFRRYHADQWHGLPESYGKTSEIPPAYPERLQRPVP